MVAGVALGKLAPAVVATLRRFEFGAGSQIKYAPIRDSDLADDLSDDA